MSNSKIKFRRKLLAVALSVMMLIAMVPATVLTSAWGNTDPAYDYLSAQGLTANYVVADDNINVSWTAIEGDVDTLSLSINGGEAVELDTSATSYTVSAAAYAGKTVAVSLIAVCGEEGRTVEASVFVPATLVNVPSSSVNMDNNLTLAAILNLLPEEMPVVVTDNASVNVPVIWSPDGINYDHTLADAQSFEVNGTITLPETILNRNNVDPTLKLIVNVSAATDVSIKTDLDPNPIQKLAGESLLLSVEGQGTVMGYQWYRDGVAIDGACNPTLNIASLTPADAGNYYCQILGKGSSSVISQVVTVSVAKCDTNVVIAIDPKTQSRPYGVVLKANGIPGDATGTLTFMVGDTAIGTVNLPSLTIDFRATGTEDNYNFSVIYSGDERYNGSTSAVAAYSFNKGTISMGNVSGLTGVAGTTVQVLKPIVTLIPHSNAIVTYTFSVNNPEIAEVSNTGFVTYKKAGEFVLTITATAGDDYNDAHIDIPIVVHPAKNSGLKFETDAGTDKYSANFSHVITYYDTSMGEGALSVSLEGAFAEHLLATLDTENKKIYITYKDIDGTDPNLSQNLTGDVTVILTKGGDQVYADYSIEYVLHVNKGQQAAISVENTLVTLPYGNDGTLQAISGGTVKDNVSYTISDDSIIQLNGDGTFTTLRPGDVDVIVTKAGNALYDSVSCNYVIRVTKGTMEGFAFTDAEISAAYGQPVTNTAQGGPAGDVTYAISSAEGDLINYLIIDPVSGTVSFNANSHLAANRDSYKVEISATKNGGELYNDSIIKYTITFARKAVTNADFVLDGAEILSNGNIRSNFGNEDSSKTGITITPANGYTAIRTKDNDQWYDHLFLESSAEDVTVYLKTEDGEISQALVKNVIVDKQGPGSTPGNVQISIGTNAYRDDAINSVWSGFTGILSFDLWKESSKEIVIKAKDDVSPIKDIYYYVQTEGFVTLDKNPEDITLDDIKPLVEGFDWTACNVVKDMQYGYKSQFIIDLPENTTKKAVVYVKIIDAANNVSYFRSTGIIFDNMAPSCDVEILSNSIINVTLPEVDGQVGLYNGAVDFAVNIQDENGITAGIETIKVTVNGFGGNGQWYEQITTVTAKESEIAEFHSTDCDLDSFKALFDVNGSFTIPASFDSNHLSILVEVWDFAGNYASTEHNRTHLAIDSSKPEIDIFYQELTIDSNAQGGFNSDLKGNDSKYLGQNQYRRATITVKDRNFIASGVNFNRLLLDGETLGVNPTFTCVAADYNGDSYEWVATIDFVKDGDYNFNIACTDKANNTNNNQFSYEEWIINPYSWTIDNTKPVIRVEMSNNNVKNGSYFSAARMATITITERNFDKANELFNNWTGITLDGTISSAPKAKWIKSDATTHEHVYTISFAKDGDYRFDVTYTDLAGNIAEGYTCNAASYESFTVDTTAPAINITGVAHQNAYNYNDVVAPIITYSDINIDNTTASVRLNGARNGNVQYKRSEQIFGTGKRISYNDFSKVSYMDDIYTLSVSLADKAGNISSQLVTFSVNRFGSTYDLSMLENIIGKYLREEQDIVFTETNVTELDHETLLIKMIKDGTPTALVEGTDYTIEKTGGNGQWSVYKYTIKKELFVNDGHYNISVYSEDGAGNINESDSEDKKADISFAIDKTAPVIVPIDLEDNTPYATDNKTVSVEIKDNLLLDGVTILLNGKEVAYTADGDNYTFDISQSGNRQNVAIVAMDAAGNTLPIEIKDVLINANFFVRWYNNTALFISTLVGVALLILLLTALALFGKKKAKK